MDVWATIKEICQSADVQLFDLDVPKGKNGVLRVFISKIGTSEDIEGEPLRGSPKVKGVGHEECVKIASAILDHPLVDQLVPEDCTVEVSSPGINRKLRREEHFLDAIGERVKISYHNEEGKKESVTGILEIFKDGYLSLKEESKNKEIKIPYGQIKKAQIDFIFSN